MDITNFIDHALLLSTATESDIIKLCIEAKEYKFNSVNVNSCYVQLAEQLLRKSDVKICASIGYPIGASTTNTKIFEAKEAIANGADEIDMVINLGLIKSRNNIAVLKDLADVKLAIGQAPLNATIEISELSKNEIIRVSEICLDAKVDYIKTSTGFSKSGATLTAVKIIRKTIRDRAKIKASFGEWDYDTAMRYIDVGVDRIVTNEGVNLMEEKNEIRNRLIREKSPY